MSKEEIEKAKETCNSIVNFCKNNKECQKNEFCPDCYIEVEDVKAIKALLQYIDQIEQEKDNLINIMKADRMEQLDDYVIYLINKYLKELGVLEDE